LIQGDTKEIRQTRDIKDLSKELKAPKELGVEIRWHENDSYS